MFIRLYWNNRQVTQMKIFIHAINMSISMSNVSRSPDGPGGRVCGHRSGYSTVTSAKRRNELGQTSSKPISLSIIAQNPNYKWNIKITQIACSEVIRFCNRPMLKVNTHYSFLPKCFFLFLPAYYFSLAMEAAI